MVGSLQKGIYHFHEPHIGNSFCVIFLRASGNTSAQEFGGILAKIWVKLQDLEKGIVSDLDVNPKKRSSGNLSAMVGYGPKSFQMDGSLRNNPQEFRKEWIFNEPRTGTNDEKHILDQSKISYAKSVQDNHALVDQVVIQLIADTEFHTSRALVEIWKELYKINKLIAPRTLAWISKYYTGFHSPTSRSLIGFHDGVSNIKTSERLNTISIKSGPTKDEDWTINGTYMGFLRIVFNLEAWEDIDVNKQEIIIGRDKKTGCPLIGVDRNGRPVKDSRCPKPGTYEVTDPGNEIFRNRPSYGHQTIPASISDRILQNSHIATTLPKDLSSGLLKPQIQIFRQSFQFLEPSDSGAGFRMGLNFVSFQNSPENLYKSMIYKPAQKMVPTKVFENPIPGLNDFFTVMSAGVFFVPPTEKHDLFPGSSIFLERKKF
jgi:deferrochelatase/peroxidase EfeB